MRKRGQTRPAIKASSSSSVNNVRDLTKLPPITFAYVEKNIKSASVSSGSQQMSKGFKYYSEQNIPCLVSVDNH